MNSTAPRRGIFAALLATAFAMPSGRAAAPLPIYDCTDSDATWDPPPAIRDYGNPPRNFGLSRECAKQRRKNKLRRLGIGGDRR